MSVLKAISEMNSQEIFKALLLRLPATTSANADGEAVDTILFDVEAQGGRYLLIRMCPIDSQSQVILSPREQEITRMVAKGYPNKAIAGVLNISTWTVCTHVRRVFAKLNVTSRAAMVAKLLQEDPLSRLTEPPTKQTLHRPSTRGGYEPEVGTSHVDAPTPVARSAAGRGSN